MVAGRYGVKLDTHAYPPVRQSASGRKITLTGATRRSIVSCCADVKISEYQISASTKTGRPICGGILQRKVHAHRSDGTIVDFSS